MMSMDSSTDTMDPQDGAAAASAGNDNTEFRSPRDADNEEDENSNSAQQNIASSRSTPLHHVVAEATLVTDEVAVAIQVDEEAHRAQISLFQLLLCDPLPQTLDEMAVQKLLREFPFLFQRKYKLNQRGTTSLASTLDETTTRTTSCCTCSPLSLICRLRPSMKLLKAVHQINPVAVTQTDELGRLPLHLACKWDMLIHGRKFLVQVYAEGAQVSDSNGTLASSLVAAIQE